MMNRKSAIVTIAMLFAMSPAFGGTAKAVCPTPGESEEVQYAWRLRGGLSWVAAIAFPTSGTATLRTSGRSDSARVETDLIIRGSGASTDYYRYESEIEGKGLRTVMSFHGYSWGRKEKEERTRLDYGKKNATTVKRSYKTEKDRIETEPIPDKDLRDVLTGIYFLRKKADSIVKPIATDIYSDQKLYPVLYQPLGKKARKVGGETIEVVGFEIKSRPGDEKKWSGGVEVWFTTDGRAIPVAISINQRFATMELELASAACGEHQILLSRR